MFGRDDEMHAVFSFGSPREFLRARRLLADGAGLHDARLALAK
jgi:hypothetical protein